MLVPVGYYEALRESDSLVRLRDELAGRLREQSVIELASV